MIGHHPGSRRHGCTCPPDTHSPDGYRIFTPAAGCPEHDQRESCGCSRFGRADGDGWHEDTCRYREIEELRS